MSKTRTSVPLVYVGKYCVRVSGSSDGDGYGGCYGDAVTSVHVLRGSDLADQLEALAKVFRNTQDNLTGSAEIVVLRRIGGAT